MSKNRQYIYIEKEHTQFIKERDVSDIKINAKLFYENTNVIWKKIILWEK